MAITIEPRGGSAVTGKKRKGTHVGSRRAVGTCLRRWNAKSAAGSGRREHEACPMGFVGDDDVANPKYSPVCRRCWWPAQKTTARGSTAVVVVADGGANV